MQSLACAKSARTRCLASVRKETIDMTHKCESCGVPLPIKVGDKIEVYYGCDELGKILCADCFEKVGCEEKHGEGCMTSIFEVSEED